MSQATQYGDSVIVARMSDARVFAAILKTIHFVEEATCILSENGMKFSVDQAKAIQARAFLQKEIFDEYTFFPEQESTSEFKINLNVLLECLNMFGTGSLSVSLRLTYAGYGTPVLLTMEQQGIVIDCSVKTLETSHGAEIDIKAADIPSNIIMKSEWLAEVFASLDTTSESITLHLSPDKPFFRLVTHGQAGSMQVDCPKDSDVVESFSCERTLVNKYKLKLLKSCERALSVSSKISVRVNAFGTLSIQLLMQLDGVEHAIFVEYLCLPEDGEESPEKLTLTQG